MSCCGDCSPAPNDGPYRRILWIALVLNAVMFVVEMTAGFAAQSASLQADAIDFLGDAANYGISLFVLGMALRWRAQAALFKGITMGAFGIWVAGNTIMHAMNGTLPGAEVMGAVGFLALVTNVAVAWMLFAYREGDANMRSVWICSRNDAIGNVAVMLAALGVFGTGTGWPDFIVAGVMAVLAISGSVQVIRQAMDELKSTRVIGSVPAE